MSRPDPDAIAPEPVNANQRVVLTGNNHAQVGIRILHIGDWRSERSQNPALLDPAPPGYSNVIFTLDLDNTGAVRLGSRLDQQASVLDSVGVSYPANHVVSLSAGPPVLTDSQFDSTGRILPAWQLDPGQQTERQVAFTVPWSTTLVRLHITMRIGSVMSSVGWKL
jgi:hypothetical protein